MYQKKFLFFLKKMLKSSFYFLVYFFLTQFYRPSLCFFVSSQILSNLSSSSYPSQSADLTLSFLESSSTRRWYPFLSVEDKPNINELHTKNRSSINLSKISRKTVINNCNNKICKLKTGYSKETKMLDKIKEEENNFRSNIIGEGDDVVNRTRLFSSETIKMNNTSHTYLKKEKEGWRQYSSEWKRRKANHRNDDFLRSRHRHKTVSKINDFQTLSPYSFLFLSFPFSNHRNSSIFNAPFSSSPRLTRTVKNKTSVIQNFSKMTSNNLSFSNTSQITQAFPLEGLSSLKGNVSPYSITSSTNSPSISSSTANSSMIMAHDEASFEAHKTRVNVVDENPTLDVGPLVLLTVKENTTASLPCSQSPLSLDDAVRLILWYRNDTTRPLISYDARESQKPRKDDIFARSKEAFQRREFIQFFRAKWIQEVERRISLGRGGETLVLHRVNNKDQAEYRCTVHYKKLPSVAHRLQLLVEEKISNVHIYDSANYEVVKSFGPFPEGTEITLTCKANCSTKSPSIKQVNWLIGGDDLWSEWKKVNNSSGISELRLKLLKTHAERDLTCRVTCRNERFARGGRTSIVDKSIGLQMLYVPQVRLFIDGSSSKNALWNSEEALGGGIEVLEMKSLTFVCLVRSSPRAYNVTWMKDGQVFDLSSKSWLVQNGTLTIPKIHQSDSGLYTCVASNSEGDGQSNAIIIRVAYTPYCKGPNNKHFTIGRNSTIVLQCNVNAYPSNVTFSWRRTNAYPIPKIPINNNIYTTKISQGRDQPELIELVPDNIDDLDFNRFKNNPLPQGPPLPHFEDPKTPTRSLLTLYPDAKHVGIVCLSRNKVGRTREPCYFRISVVDSPSPPIGCHVNSVGVSSLKVDCKLRASSHDLSPSQQTPGLSPVRSPGIKGASLLEVWSKGVLLSNLTSNRGHWYVSHLPPDTALRLHLYSLSSHVSSEPVVLYAKTLPKEEKRLRTNEAERASDSITDIDLPSMEDEEEEVSPPHLLIIIGGIVLGFSFLLLVILSGLLTFRLVRREIRRRQRRGADSTTDTEEDRGCSVGEGDPWSMQVSYPETYDTIATSPL